jgi:hypothetical protein
MQDAEEEHQAPRNDDAKACQCGRKIVSEIGLACLRKSMPTIPRGPRQNK